MSFSVVLSNSPIFSLFPKNKNSIISSSSEPLPLLPSTTSSCSSPSSPSSPFHFVLPKTVNGFSGAGSAPSSSALKRKRPAKLDIPVVASLTVGVQDAAVPMAEERDVVEVEGRGFAVYCKRGRREHMEDRYSAAVDFHGEPKQAFFGIYDGHGGTKASEFAAHNLEKNVMDEVVSRDESDVEEAVKCGYLNTDSDFLKENLHGGSCCVTTLIRNGNLIVSNVGDCRAVISRGGVAEALTSDHRPSREDERERIETQGGYIDIYHGVWRIEGSLAVSRGIGDRHLKQWVIAEPETKVFRIEPLHDLLILASDGLWEK
ncbi:PREDICTED: probable protein phosphatase 2C 25 isoform X2 [Lupinus angustifolius]|nr:PREDICTED: probable protein phosphatase 2C 25 isoform X2 [Lupinus angustifolius]